MTKAQDDIAETIRGRRGDEGAGSHDVDGSTAIATKAEPRRPVPTFLGGAKRVTAAQLEREIAGRTQTRDEMISNPALQDYPGRLDAYNNHIAALTSAREKFGPDYEPPRNPFKPAKIIDAGADKVVSVATDERHGAAPDSKTFKIFPKPETETTRQRDLGRPLGQVDVRRHADGRWEVSMVEVRPGARGKGVATALYGAVQRELGVEMSPSGILLPDGYKFWQARDPAKVQYHQPFEGAGGTVYYSPKRISALLENPRDPARAVELQSTFDALPPEAKTQSAMDAMFNLRRSGEEPSRTGGGSVDAAPTSTLGELLQHHAGAADTTGNAALAKRLSGIVGDLPVHVVDRDGMAAMKAGRGRADGAGYETAGFFDPHAGHIVLLDDALRDPREAASLVVHEGLHGALLRTINASAPAREIIDHLRETAVAAHHGRGGTAGEHYGLTNAHEFVSEAMSSPDFQRFLRSLLVDPRTVERLGLGDLQRPTMWQAMVHTIRRMLGFPPGAYTALDAAMAATNRLLDTAETARRAAPRQSPSAASPPSPSAALTDRAAALMPAIRKQAAGTLDGAAHPQAEGFGANVANGVHLPTLLASALAPRWNGGDAGYRKAFAAMERAGVFSPQEQALMERETPRFALLASRAFPLASVNRMDGSSLRAAAFAHFANGREEEGMEGGHLHIDVRRAFERVYQAMSGLQSLGNRLGLYGPGDVLHGARTSLAGLSPTNPGEAMRAQQ